MIYWLKKFFQDPRAIGSIAPSSSSLAKFMSKNLPGNAQVLELGPGDGSITKHILTKLNSPKQLTLVEIDKGLADLCRLKFPETKIHTIDAEQFLLYGNKFNFIISGIPFAVMDQKKRQRIFKSIYNNLLNDGAFIMFQYSKTTYTELKNIFPIIQTEFTPWNIPPAYIYFCYKKSSAVSRSEA